jgi:hypothetical protein
MPGFWDEFLDVAGKALVSMAGAHTILKWNELPLDEAEYEIKRFVRTSSEDEIRLVFEGFVGLCTSERDSEQMRDLLLLYRSYCIYTARRFGDD